MNTFDELDYLDHPLTNSQSFDYNSLRNGRHSVSYLKERSLSSTPSEHDWVSPFTLPPLPSFRRDRQHQSLTSPEYLRQRDGSGAYYAAAWGSPYATPSPRRTPQPPDSPSPRLNLRGTPLPSSSRSAAYLSPEQELGSGRSRSRRRLYGELDRLIPVSEARNPRSERPNWLSDSDDSGSERGQKLDENTPTRVAYLDGWGPSPVGSVRRSPVKHRSTESLATVTQDTFHAVKGRTPASQRYRTPLPSQNQNDMAEHERAEESVATPDKPLPGLPTQQAQPEHDANTSNSPAPTIRPRPASIPSYQRPKKKVIWKGKACIIALPLTDRDALGLPPLLRPEEIRQSIEGWIASGYSVNGFELTEVRPDGAAVSHGQSRPVFPDPADITAEHN
jgi:hypothetical protein